MSEQFRKLLAQRQTTPVSITPHIGIVTLQFQLYGIPDLKAKRKADDMGQGGGSGSGGNRRL